MCQLPKEEESIPYQHLVKNLDSSSKSYPPLA
jgi:hypothetical protein